jgi:hypothetical protein
MEKLQDRPARRIVNFSESIMIPFSNTSDPSWKSSYSAALFQDDKTKIPTLIARAESEIVARARALFEAPGENAPEMRALNNALQMLQVLKNCIKPTERVPGSSSIPPGVLDHSQSSAGKSVYPRA